MTTTTVDVRKTMWGAVRSEVKRLNRPTFVWVGLVLIVLFAFVGTSIVFAIAEQAGDAPMPPGIGQVVDVESSRGIVAGLSMAADLIGIVALSLWAAAAAADYSSGWIRVMVQAEPRRWRLLAGKFAALAGFTVIGTTIATIVSVGLAPGMAERVGTSTELWSDGTVGTVIGGWANLTLAVLIWGIIGFTVATIARSAIVAIAGGIGYLMVFEGLLGLAAEDATTYLPGSVLGSVVAGGTDSLAYGTALLLGLTYAAVAAGAAIYLFHRRDITS